MHRYVVRTRVIYSSPLSLSLIALLRFMGFLSMGAKPPSAFPFPSPSQGQSQSESRKA